MIESAKVELIILLIKNLKIIHLKLKKVLKLELNIINKELNRIKIINLA